MSWSIAEVARLSGVSSRALRHYHHIGLLPPARVGANGWRYYERDELLRLQRILLLRELGLGLGAVAEMLAQEDRHRSAAVLRRHRDRLVVEQQRFARLIDTVERTITHIEKGGEMTAESMFEGFAHNPYEAEARERWGDDAVDASKERIKAWSADEAEKARGGYERVHSGLAPLLAAEVPPSDPRVQELVGLHHEVTSLFWDPTPEAYRNLGQMYVDDERFRRNIGQGNDDLVAYLRDAMAVYADTRLTQ